MSAADRNGDSVQVRERIARAIYKQGGYCGNCSFEGWDSCAECRRTLLGYAVAVLDVLGLERVHWSEHHGGYLYRLAEVSGSSAGEGPT